MADMSRSSVERGTRDDRWWPALGASPPRGVQEQSAESKHRLDPLVAVSCFVRGLSGQRLCVTSRETPRRAAHSPHVAILASSFGSCALTKVGNLISAIQEVLEVIKVVHQDSVSKRIVDQIVEATFPLVMKEIEGHASS